MKIILILLFGLGIFFPQAHAVQEVAGKINVDIKPGETKSFSWSILSDSNKTDTLIISASGSGSEFLTYPKSITLAPKEFKDIQVNVTIPSSYSTANTLTPFLTATESGQLGGPTIINLSVLKIATINIQPSSIPEFGSMSSLVLVLAIIVSLVMFRKSNYWQKL